MSQLTPEFVRDFSSSRLEGMDRFDRIILEFFAAPSDLSIDLIDRTVAQSVHAARLMRMPVSGHSFCMSCGIVRKLEALTEDVHCVAASEGFYKAIIYFNQRLQYLGGFLLLGSFA